jgi:hypothetical protein
MSITDLYDLFADRLNFHANIHLSEHIKLSYKTCDVYVHMTFYAIYITGMRSVYVKDHLVDNGIIRVLNI